MRKAGTFPGLLFSMLTIGVLTGCAGQSTPAGSTEAPPLQRIAFGSCSEEDHEQPLWSHVLSHHPDLWIWLGDNIYGDTEDMSLMAEKYARQKSHPDYQRLLASAQVIGTWDDHDYGVNNGGKEYPKREASQQQLLDFLDVPEDSPRRERAGVYAAHTYGPAGRQVKVILLDTRFHRDSIGSNGDMLGEEQWAWLEQELRSSTAQVNIIGSSIQVIPEEQRFEKWANFPRERDRLFQLIAETGAPGVIFLSGDRHIAEIMRYDDPRVGYPLYEVTASGLTHTWDDPNATEPNRYRLGEMLVALNFGLLEIDWNSEPARIHLQVRDQDDALRLEEVVSLAELQPVE